jgi:signal peptidase I
LEVFLTDLQTETLPEETPSKEKSGGIGRFILDIVETLLFAAILVIGINFVSARIRVDGFSMEPTLHTGEFVIINKLAYKLGEPGRGDVIVFRYPFDPQQEYIKRVIGLPGDVVKIEGGSVFINGNKLDESYIAAPPQYQNQITVPEDSLFVLGDNRNNSSDSHNWGPVPRDFVIGKALFVYWPPEQWGLVQNSSSASAAP